MTIGVKKSCPILNPNPAPAGIISKKPISKILTLCPKNYIENLYKIPYNLYRKYEKGVKNPMGKISINEIRTILNLVRFENEKEKDLFLLIFKKLVLAAKGDISLNGDFDEDED